MKHSSQLPLIMVINLRSTSFSFFFILLLHITSHFANAQPFIGINYGQLADNLPPPSAAVKLLQTTTITKLRLYNADASILNALSNAPISVSITAPNDVVPSLSSDPHFAKQWITTNVVPFYPATNITLVNVGNEVLTSGDRSLMEHLLPAMRNVRNALEAAALGVKVSTVHSMAVLGESEPPSAGSFKVGIKEFVRGVLGFCSESGAPFSVNPYPFFAYQSDPRDETLSFCLFRENAGRVDKGTKIKYTNMFDAQVDAVRSALNSMGFKDVEIVVAETGWPYKGDANEVGPSIENAKAYNANLISHLRSMVGTPLMPGKSVDTYLFALFDEDLKSGKASERSFGLFKPDLTMTYDVGLSKTSTQTPPTPKYPVTPSTPSTPTMPKAAAWCVPKPGVSDVQLQANLDYACAFVIDCAAIQPGGACFEPNTVVAHATYAMNLYYQTVGRNPWNCDFSQTATLTFTNPSYGKCIYPGGSTKEHVC